MCSYGSTFIVPIDYDHQVRGRHKEAHKGFHHRDGASRT
jgi:hypothetical protein